MDASRIAALDSTLTAVVVARASLYYDEGADASLDRPAQVRAGSSLAWVPGGIALIQDDANFIAVVEPEGPHVRAIPLPAGKGGRRQFDRHLGNKKHKLDLEACVSLEQHGHALLVALGSGSKRHRDHVALVRGWESAEPDVTMVQARDLYRMLRHERAFAGSELNVEGAVCLGSRVRLFGRGNGAPRDGVPPVNATCDLDWAMLYAYLLAPERSTSPAPANIVRYHLGTVGRLPLTFTDATVWRDALLYTAAAEASPDATRDGRVTGSAIGVIDSAGHTRWTPLIESSGEPFVGKVEGLVVARDDDDTTPRLYVVVDADDPDAASELCTVELRGRWSAQ